MQEYTSTDQQLHILSQIIAKANRTFVNPTEDDSHTNLGFDSIGNRITGRWIDSPIAGKIILVLNLNSQNFEWVNTDQSVIASYATIGKHITEIEADIENGLLLLGLSTNGFTDKLHYDIPKYSFTDSPIQKISSDGLWTWANYRLLANEACSAILNYLSVEGEIRIWPHHFDTGIYVQASDNIGIGFGLAMEDQMAGAPYLYMSGYPLIGKLPFEQVNNLSFGKWIISEHWNGSILTLEELEEFPEAGTTYIGEALSWYLSNAPKK